MKPLLVSIFLLLPLTLRAEPLPRPYAVTIGPSGDLLVLENSPSAISRIQVNTKLREIVADKDHGNGPMPSQLDGIAVLPNGDIAISTIGDSSNPRSLLLVDPTTGARRVLSAGRSDNKFGRGPGFSLPVRLAVTPGGTILVVDQGPPKTVFEVDPKTGNRRDFLNSVASAGPSITRPTSVIVEENGTAFVIDAEAEALIRIDPSGLRHIVADASHGRGPSLKGFGAIAPMSSDSLAIIGGGAITNAILIVDRETGDRRILSGKGRGAGPEMISPSAIAYHPDGYLVVTDSFLRAIVRVTPSSGDRSILFQYP